MSIFQISQNSTSVAPRCQSALHTMHKALCEELVEPPAPTWLQMRENIQVMQVETCAVCRTSISSFGAAICPALLQTVPLPLTLASEPVWPAKCDSPSSLARALAAAPVKLPSKTLVVFSASGCASRAPSASDEGLKCNPGPSSWAASPMSTSTKASLALRLATGVPGSLPDSTRTLPGTVPPHHAIWICLALLTVFKYAEAIRVVARVKSCIYLKLSCELKKHGSHIQRPVNPSEARDAKT
ncbi:hypothetical protein R3P38DRAFT_3598974 [Favolaschia claudopus]|uniref:Uncharacterized protein n=1 Tax=Favolaschia claudopus TaxID=2862362 RepID=A0AAW0AE24_9AGAR